MFHARLNLPAALILSFFIVVAPSGAPPYGPVISKLRNVASGTTSSAVSRYAIATRSPGCVKATCGLSVAVAVKMRFDPSKRK